MRGGAAPDPVITCDERSDSREGSRHIVRHAQLRRGLILEAVSRIERLLERLPAGASAIACDPANVRWLTGLAGEPHQLYGMAALWAVVGPHGALRIVAPASELAWIEESHGLNHVISHGRFSVRGRPSRSLLRAVSGSGSLIDALRDAVDAVDGHGEVVVDDCCRPSEAQRLIAALQPLSVRFDRSPWLAARTLKDAQEVEQLRRANAAAEAGLAHALARADVGVTELDLVRWVRQTIIEHGARPLLASVGISERGALVDFTPSERRLAEGEVIRFDVGCIMDGYHADLARTAVLGDPPQWLLEVHAALLAGEEAALQALAPGVTGGDLFECSVAAVRAAGIVDYDRTHCGHGIGLDMYELPHIRPGASVPLQAGSTCCIETPLYLIGQAGVQIEDAVYVTMSGYERLGSLPRALLRAGTAAAFESLTPPRLS